MKTFKLIPIFKVLFAGLVLSACDYTPEAMLGHDREADEVYTTSTQSFPCDEVYSSVKEGTGECATPYIAGTLSETDGDNGNVVYYLKQLSDGNYPLVQTLKFEAKEQVTIGGTTNTATYDIVFNCTAGNDTPEHLRPFHCVAQAAPRLRTKPQTGGATVKFKTMTVENPSCHATVTYTGYQGYCYPGSMVQQDIKSPTLGLEKP